MRGEICLKRKLFITAAAMATAFMMGIPSFANTLLDSYSYIYITGGAADTSVRRKDTQSNAYMICSECVNINTHSPSAGSFYGVVYGSANQYNGFINPVTEGGKSSSTYYFTVGSEHYMSNYVYQVYVTEKNNAAAFARVRGTMAGSTGYIQLSGKWAPDT